MMLRQRVPRRLAWRELRRHPGNAWLIILLVALPVAAAMVASILISSATPTAEQQVRHDMGSFPAKLVRMDDADGHCLQATASFPSCGTGQSHPEFKPVPADKVVPPDAIWERSVRRDVRFGGLVLDANVAVVAVKDQRLAGRWVADVLPGDTEVLVSKQFLATIQKRVGDGVTVADHEYRIAGIFRSNGNSWSGGVTNPALLVGPTHPLALGADFVTAMLPTVPGRSELDQWNRAGYGVFTADALAADYASDASGPIAAGLLVAMLVVYLVIGSIVGAAFTMSIRRRQRSLALLRATGADSRTLRNAVLWEGALLGVGGGLAGVAVGAALGITITNLALETGFLGIQDVNVTWWHAVVFLTLTLVVTVLVATLAARGVLNADALASLRGAQAASPRLRPPLIGMLLLLLGAAMAWLTWWLAARYKAEHVDYAMTQAFYAALVSVIALWLAWLALGGWLLQRVATRGSRWLALRMALREANRNRGRMLSIVAATASATVLTVLPLAALGYGNAEMIDRHRPKQPRDVMFAVTWPGPDGAGALENASHIADSVMGARSEVANFLMLMGGESESWGLEVREDCNPCSYMGQLAIGGPDFIRLALGRQDPAAEQALAAGKVVVLQRDFMFGERVKLAHYPNDGEPMVREVDGYLAGQVVGFPPLVSPERATELGVIAESHAQFLRYPRNVTEHDAERLNDLLRGTANSVYYQTETGPYPGYRQPMPYVAAVGVAVGLGIAVIGVALAIRDGAASRMLLANLGARRRTLRGAVAVQSLYSVGFGVFAGASAALVPFLAMSVGMGGRWDLLPWGWIAAVVLVPVPLTAAVAALITRPRPARVVAD